MTPGDQADNVKQRRPLRLSDLASDHIRELVVSGQLPPGEFIRPEVVADELGISATPVREGLLQLHTEGFVTMSPRRGWLVSELSEEDLSDVYEAQALLGGELTARAAFSCDDQVVALLENLQSQLEAAAASRNYEEVERLNHHFHEVIYREGGSRKLRWLLKRTLAYAPRKFFAAVEGWPEASAADHRAIINHLRAHEAEQARDAMARHIRKAGELLSKHFAAGQMPDVTKVPAFTAPGRRRD